MRTDFILIDDDPIFNFLNEQVVSAAPCVRETLVFDSASEALRKINGLTESTALKGVIFLDVRMPLMNGFEFLEQFQKIPSEKIKDAQVYMLSSSIDEADRLKAKQFPVVKGFLNKPLTEEMVAGICSNLKP